MPDSFSVGTAAKRGMRLSLQTASSRSLPASTYGTQPEVSAADITWPAMTACNDSGVPLNGT